MRVYSGLRVRILVCLTALCLATVSLLAQQTKSPTTQLPAQLPPVAGVPASPAPPAAAPAADSRAEIRVGSGDLLEIAVYGAPDFAKSVRVSSSGDVSLPLIGAVHVAGLTLSEAEKKIAQLLDQGGYFNNPQVSVFEKEYATQAISVLGEVKNPGLFPLLGQRTLFDAISAAGGTTPKAGKTVTITHRDHSQPPKTIELAYDADGSVRSNVPVMPGDTVVVSKAGIVYVVGDVKLPSGIVLENPGMTVLQVIAMAQGTNPTASLDGAKLIRSGPEGRKEIPLPLKKILTSKAEDIAVQPDDIIFVPSSAAKSAGRRGLEAAIQMATGLAIYRRP